MKSFSLPVFSLLLLAAFSFAAASAFAAGHGPKRGSSLGAFQRCLARGAQAYPGDKDSQDSIASSCFDHYVSSFGSFSACLGAVKLIYRGDSASQESLRDYCLDTYEEAFKD